ALFLSSRRRHTRCLSDWSSDVCSSDLHLRGRLAGIEMISYTTGPLLGNAEAGIVASLFSVRTSIISGGVLCIAGTGLLAMVLPRSEERRVGNEGGSWRRPGNEK